MSDEIYRRLADFLDHLGTGFAPSTTGAELRLLRLLFIPEEAELELHLTLECEGAAAIAERAGLPLDIVAQRLAEMDTKGLIYSVVDEQGNALYQAVPWVVGIWEYQVNRMTPEFVKAADDYWSTQVQRRPVRTIAQMRVIPIGESLEPELEALPYEQVKALVADNDRFAVAPCICRRSARLHGNGCDAPEESCLIFGEAADYYVRGGRARAITREEMLDLLARADAANLVLQPSNSQAISAICCCCGCCCGVLADLKRLRRPARHVVSAFIAELDDTACIHCGRCLQRCQMDALSDVGDRVALDVERCIGCGLCVSTCPSGALKLTRKAERSREAMPADMGEMWRTVTEQRAQRRG